MIINYMHYSDKQIIYELNDGNGSYKILILIKIF